MLHTLERALPSIAKRPGLLQPYDVLDILACRRNRQVTATELADCMEKPVDQVLHALSYLTSMGMLEVQRVNGAWYYGVLPTAMAS